MKNPTFERAKLDRMLKTHGVEYTFKRPAKNEFGENASPPAYEPDVVTLIGVYHEGAGYTQVMTDAGVSYRSKKIPMILTSFEYSAQRLLMGDVVEINSVVYYVTGVRSVGNWNIYGDISLEVFDDGRQV